MVAWI